MSEDDEKWLELAKLKQQDFFNRRELEWKLSFWIWGGIAAFTFAMMSDKISQDNLDLGYLKASYIGIAMVFVVWQVMIQIGHHRDTEKYGSHLGRLEIDSPNSSSCKCCKCWKQVVWGSVHVAVTIAFLVGSYVVISSLKSN